jgi:LysR family glycine cleavage system transcriptional activator
MFKHLPSLKALRAFEAAARHSSFTRAAMELSLTQGAISYQVRHLEAELGIALFKRSARQVRLTAEGQSLYRTTHRLLRELEDEIHHIAPGQDQLILTVSVSTFFVTRWLSKRLGNFLNSYPEITLRLQHSVNDPDFAVEDVDLAIRWGKSDWPDSESELLIPSPMFAVCSPKLIKGDSPAARLEELRGQIFLHDQDSNDSWREWLRQAGLSELDAGDGPVIIDPNVRVQSAIDGHGLVLANILLNEDITAERLIKPFGTQLEGYGYHLLYTPAVNRLRAFQLFRKWLLQECADFNAQLRSPG